MATAAAILAQTAAFLPEFIDMSIAQDTMAGALVDIAAIDDANAFADASAAAILAGLASAGVAILYQQLAQKYYDLYDHQRTFYYNNFQNNVMGELGLIQQTQALPIYTPQYDPQAANFASFQIEGMFSGIDTPTYQWWNLHANMYHDDIFLTNYGAYGTPTNIGPGVNLDNASITADFDTYLYRYEEHRTDVYVERRWEWQNQSLNFGVKQANVVQSGLATSFGFIDTATGTMSDFFATQANGLSRYGSYRHAIASNGAQLNGAARYGTKLAGLSTSMGVGDISRKEVDDVFSNSF